MARLFTGTNTKYLEYFGPAVSAMPMTFSAWLYPTSTTALSYAFAISASATNSCWILGVNASAKIIARSTSSGTTVDAVTSTTFSINTWCHACARFTSATSRDAYLNGAGKGSNTTSNTPGTVATTTIGLAHIQTSYAGAFNGRVAEVTVWNVSLSDAEIAALASGINSRCIQPSAISGYWPVFGLNDPEPDMTVWDQQMSMTGTAAYATHAPIRPFTLYKPVAPVIGTTTVVRHRGLRGSAGSRSNSVNTSLGL